ncbi:MAG: redoxin domain-containing protein [Oligoflexus sp.]|nr:redoxin domain-containing protein [Oligoflexus sp.]
MAADIYDFPLKRIDGKAASLGDFKGQVLLLVNVASKCGLTPQYEGLEKLYETYKAKGLTVVGFPANEFMGQEPGSNAEIEEFCRGTFGIQFPMFEKVVVKGEGQHPLYKYLTDTVPESVKKTDGNLESRLASKGLGRQQKQDVLWNFEKFLVDRQGFVVGRFDPDITAEDEVLLKSVQEQLDKK